MKRKRPQRPQPKQKLSSVQKQRVFRIVLVLLIISLLWLVFSPGSGILTLSGKRSELNSIKEESARMEKQNVQLTKKIEKLSSDSQVIEKVVRKDFGFLKKNEKVFDFSKQKPEKLEKPEKSD